MDRKKSRGAKAATPSDTKGAKAKAKPADSAKDKAANGGKTEKGAPASPSADAMQGDTSNGHGSEAAMTPASPRLQRQNSNSSLGSMSSFNIPATVAGPLPDGAPPPKPARTKRGLPSTPTSAPAGSPNSASAGSSGAGADAKSPLDRSDTRRRKLPTAPQKGTTTQKQEKQQTQPQMPPTTVANPAFVGPEIVSSASVATSESTPLIIESGITLKKKKGKKKACCTIS